MSSDQSRAIIPQPDAGWRPRVFLLGGLLGALLGLLSAYLYVRAAEERYGGAKPPEAPDTGDAVRLGTALLGIIRTIAEWGSR